MLKRLADWLEKMSVASMAVGLFKQNDWGLLIGAVAFFGCMALTYRGEKK